MKTVAVILLFIVGINSNMSAQIKDLNRQVVNTQQTSQADKYYFRISGITGECKENNHLNWIEGEGVEFMVKNNIINGQLSGKPTVLLKFSKEMDTTSDDLAFFIETNKVISTLDIEVVKTINKKQVTVLKIQVFNTLISNYVLKTDEKTSQTLEYFECNPQNVKATYFTYDSLGNGVSNREVTFGQTNY